MTISIILGIIVLIAVSIGPFASKMQSVTLWAGKKIAKVGLDDELPQGYQDAITPKIQDIFNTILPICYVTILVLGSIKIWYLGFVLLIFSIIIIVILKNFWSNKIIFYLKIINHYMINKTADYEKSSDTMRAKAAKDLTDRLLKLYFEIKTKNLKIPSMREINSMRLGD